MPLTANPLLPASSDLLWSVVVVAAIALGVAAFVGISRRARTTPLAVSLTWIAIVLLLPVVGPLAWFVAGRRSMGQPVR